MRSLCILASGLALVWGAGSAAYAATDDVGPATASQPVLTVDPASDKLNGDVQAHNDAIEAENQAAQARYQAQLASFEQEKRTQQDAYSAALAAHDAQVAADTATWQARVRACEGGDTAQCAH